MACLFIICKTMLLIANLLSAPQEWQDCRQMFATVGHVASGRALVALLVRLPQVADRSQLGPGDSSEVEELVGAVAMKLRPQLAGLTPRQLADAALALGRLAARQEPLFAGIGREAGGRLADVTASECCDIVCGMAQACFYPPEGVHLHCASCEMSVLLEHDVLLRFHRRTSCFTPMTQICVLC